METAIENPQQIVTCVQEFALSEQLAGRLVETFGPMFAEAKGIIEQSSQIKVTDATQLSEMKRCKTLRLQLRDIRTGADKARKAMKEESLRTGQAIEKVSKVVSMLTEPEEARLEEAEKFAERAEAKRKGELKSAREGLLAPFGVNTAYYQLGDMPEAQFAELLASTRLAHEATIAEAARIEAERVAAAKAKAEEDARVRAENARLQAEAAEKEAAAKAAREEAAAALAAEQAKAKAAQDAADAELRKANEARIAAEKEAQRVIDEAAAKAEAARLADAKKAKDEAAAAAKAARAPDRDKLTAYAAALRAVVLPATTTPEGKAAARRAASIASTAADAIDELIREMN